MAFSLTRGSYNKLRQLLWLLPVVILIDMQVVIPITRTWSHTSQFIIHHNFWPYHITWQLLQKQVRRPLIVVASFTWLQLGSSKNVSYLRKSHNVICQFLFTLHKDPFHRLIRLKWERLAPASHLMQQLHVSRWNLSHVSVRVRSVRAASSHNAVETRLD